MKKAVATVNNVELSEQDFEIFKLFMQNHQNIAIMFRRDFWGVRNGSLTVHFDYNGVISSIVKNERVY